MLSVLLAIGVVAAAPARGVARERTMLVMVDKGTLSDPLAGELRALLEGEVAASEGWVSRPPPDLTVDEIVLSLGCGRLDAGCMLKIAGALRADAMLMATVAPGDAGTLEVWWAEPRSKARAFVLVSGALRRGPDLMEAVRQVARVRLGPVRTGRINVVTSPAGATVRVDGEPVGRSPVTAAGLAAGVHLVEVSLDGHDTVAQDLLVRGGADTEVSLALARTAVRQPTSQAPSRVEDRPPSENTLAPAESKRAAQEPSRPAPVPASPPTEAEPAARVAETSETGGGGEGGGVRPAAVASVLLGGVGAAGAGLGALVLLGGLGLLGTSGVSYALIWTVQVARPLAVLVYPTSAGGVAALAAGGLFAALALGLVGVAVVLRLVLA